MKVEERKRDPAVRADPLPTVLMYAPRPPGRLDLPRLPVLGWATFAGPRNVPMASVLDNANIRFTRSGRAAIALALRNLDVGAGDRVLVPTYHCPTMVAPVVATGAQPAFYPIDEAGSPRLEALEGIDPRGIRAMIAVHYFGLPQPMAAIRAFCDRRGIALIEDCAHALFGESDGLPIGSWGDYAIASLTKFLPVTDGGCLVSIRRDIGAGTLEPLGAARELRSFANVVELGARRGRFRGINRMLTSAFALMDTLRGRSRAGMLETHATGILEMLAAPRHADTDEHVDIRLQRASHWTRWIVRSAARERIVTLRRSNYARLSALLQDMPGLRVLQATLPVRSAPYVFPIWVENPEAKYLEVRQAGVPVFRWNEVWPGTPVFPGDRGLEWATHVFQLGCHQDLRTADIDQLADTLRAILA